MLSNGFFDLNSRQFAENVNEFNDFLSSRRVNAWPVAEINESINFIDVF